MTSSKKVRSNRSNSTRSTGPKTAEGKSRSSMNSLTHGLTTARVVFLAGESKSDFEDLRVGFHTAWAPVGLAEIFLVDRMVFLAWTMGRSERVQSELLAGAVYEEEVSRLEAVTKPTFKVPDALKNGLTYLLPAGEHDDVVGQLNEKREALAKLNFAASFKRVSSGENFLGQAMRYAGEVERSFFKTLHTLERMQLQRQGEDVEPPVAVDVNVGTDRVSGGALCAKIRETPSCPEISVGGGEGHLHEEAVNWY